MLPHLNLFILGRLVRRIEGELALGKTMRVRDLGFNAVIPAMRGLMLVLVGVMSLPTLHFSMDGARMISRAIALFRQSLRALRGGFEISNAGIHDLRDESLLRWDLIIDVRTDEAGIIIRGVTGPPILASVYATHFCEVSLLLLSRVAFGKRQ